MCVYTHAYTERHSNVYFIYWGTTITSDEQQEAKNRVWFFCWLIGWGEELVRYLLIITGTLKHLQKLSSEVLSGVHVNVKVPQRIMNVLHTSEPEMGLSKELRSISVVNATVCLFFNYCFNFFLGPQTLLLNYLWFLVSKDIFLHLSRSLPMLFFSGHCCKEAINI